MERSEIVDLIRAAVRAADAGKAKGFLVNSPEALRCVETLRLIKRQHVTAEDISRSKMMQSLLNLTKNGNAKIRSEARTVFDDWRRILFVSKRDNVEKFKKKGSIGKADTKIFLPEKSGCSSPVCVKPTSDFSQNMNSSSSKVESPSRDKESIKIPEVKKNISIGKSEFLELFESAKEALDAVKGGTAMSSPEASRCVDVLNQLRRMPQSLTQEIIYTTKTGSKLQALTQHRNPNIQSAAQSLLDMWRKIVFTSSGLKNFLNKKTDNNRAEYEKIACSTAKPHNVDAKKVLHAKPKRKTGACLVVDSSAQLRPCSSITDYSPRRKVQEILAKALNKVSDDVDRRFKYRVLLSDPLKVAVFLESVMFGKLGPFNGPKKHKYRSILFNLNDASNPDLRRKVLFGEIKPERLVNMSIDELGSVKIQREKQKIT